MHRSLRACTARQRTIKYSTHVVSVCMALPGPMSEGALEDVLDRVKGHKLTGE